MEPGMTVEHLKRRLASQCGYPARQLALRSGGRELDSAGATLASLGIGFGRNRAQKQEVLMYVPHERELIGRRLSLPTTPKIMLINAH
eukprot:1181004-Prorocentrum_minimum.AAC.1